MLHEIQKQFLDGLFNLEQSPDILSVISTKGTRSAFEQFKSYRDSVIGGITEALTVSYPVVKNLVGEQFFNHLTYQYIRNHASLSPDLNDYGQQFADFIDTLNSTESVPYLSDIARVEWAWQKIINGENTQQGNLHLLESLNEEQSENIIFQLSPHASLLHSDYPVHTIWQLNQNDTIETEINIDNNEVNLLVWRDGLDMNITPIDQKSWRFLSLINQEIVFTTVCEEYNKTYSHQDIEILLTQGIQSGWIYSYKLK